MRFQLGEIQFQEDEDGNVDITRVQLMRIGEFLHWGDKLEITMEHLRELKKNFDIKVKKNDIAVDYSHMSFDKAAGWIAEVTLEAGDTELWITVEWTEAAKASILDKEYRYISSDFNMNYTDNETGQAFGWVLNGAGLTNRPFVKGMDAIFSDLDVSDEKRQAIQRILNDEDEPEKRKQIMKFSELIEAIKDMKLSDDESKQLSDALGIKQPDPEPAPAVKPEDDVELSDEGKELKAANEKIKLMEKETAFDKLLSDGDVCEAQRPPYMSGDMAAFAKLKKDVNLDGKGSGEGPGENEGGKDPETRKEAEDKIIELSEALMEKDKDLKLSDAHRKVMKDNPKLAELCQERPSVEE